ncbi:MAG: thioredoxin family protein [bacterium]|nr:thioredoxin family protein [bacterium]
MNKNVLWVMVVIVLAIGSGVAYLLGNSGSDNPMQNTVSDIQDQTMPAGQDSNSNPGGSYVDYTQSIVASSSGTKLLFFHAPWCPQCRALETDIQQTGVPSGVTIIKVDYDSNQSLRQKYGVTIQTSFVKIDDEGNLIKKYVAYDEPTLAAVKSNLL